MITFSLQDFAYLSLIFVASYVINFYLNYFRRPDRLPGPLPLPIIGNLHLYNHDVSALGKRLQSNYGEIGEIWLGEKRAIWLGRTEYLEKIFKPSSGNYNFRTPSNEGLDMVDMTSKGLIFNRDYNKWSSNRKYFTRTVSSRIFIRQSVKHTQSLFLEMEKYWEDLKR